MFEKVSSCIHHYVLELYGCSAILLKDPHSVQTALVDISDLIHLTLLAMLTYQSESQDLTVITFLTESYLSIHTRPEQGYAVIDFFTCHQQVSLEAVCHYLIDHFVAKQYAFFSVPFETQYTLIEPGAN